LKDALNRKEHWTEAHYKQLLASWGHQEPPPSGADVANSPSIHYKWCRSNAAGVGGYPCGLWILFHTMLANSDGKRAHLTLQIIFEWTQVKTDMLNLDDYASILFYSFFLVSYFLA